jgi:hypothetical protein
VLSQWNMDRLSPWFFLSLTFITLW